MFDNTQPGDDGFPMLPPTYPDLAGKVAVVTGGSRGIGAAICRLLAANGAKVVVNGRDQTAIDRVIEYIWDNSGQALGVTADVTNAAAIEQLRQRAEAEFGPADILIAVAGGYGEPRPTLQISEEQWRFVLDANLTATFLTIKSFLPGMIERRRGSIITMASTAGRQVSQASGVYSVAKAGILMLTRHIANEVGQHGVRVNGLAPGAILTEQSKLHQAPEQVRQQVAALHPLGRLGTPDDVAQAALFLASDSSAWITGITLDVAGGRVML
jgi:3-oxoacyl-[acyl-carrier protein] reductase